MIRKTYIPAKPRNKKLIGTGGSGGISSSMSGAVANSHTHANKAVLDLFRLDENGNVYLNEGFYSKANVSAYGLGLPGSSGDGSLIIVDNLESTESNKALSAYQGKVLNDKIKNLTPDEDGIYNVNIEWGNIVDKPTAFTPTQHSHTITEVDGLEDELESKASDDDLATHKNARNPHGISKTTIGLGYVDNTSDEDKPISIATQEALDLKADNLEFNALKTLFNSMFEIDKSDPLNHKIKALKTFYSQSNVSAYGLGDSSTGSGDGSLIIVDNLTEGGATKALSAQQGVVLKQMVELKASSDNVDGHITNTSNPHKVKHSQLTDKNSDKNFLHITQTEKDTFADKYTKEESNNNFEPKKENIQAHISTVKGNPHNVTKGDVGLGYVDNVQQASKVNFDAHTADESNPHKVTKAQVGLGNVTDDKQAKEIHEHIITDVTNLQTELDSKASDSDFQSLNDMFYDLLGDFGTLQNSHSDLQSEHNALKERYDELEAKFNKMFDLVNNETAIEAKKTIYSKGNLTAFKIEG